jgi:hypothetical protein
VKQTGLVDKEFVIINREPTVLSRCKAVLADKSTADIKSLKTGNTTVDKGLFQRKWVAPTVAPNHILIECAEGSAEVLIIR